MNDLGLAETTALQILAGDRVRPLVGKAIGTLGQGQEYFVVDIDFSTNTVDVVNVNAPVSKVVIPNVPMEYIEILQDDIDRCHPGGVFNEDDSPHNHFPLDPLQLGTGRSYKSLAIQPMELSHRNKLNAAQHTAIKYIMGYNIEGGNWKADLIKAKHTIDLLIHLEDL